MSSFWGDKKEESPPQLPDFSSESASQPDEGKKNVATALYQMKAMQDMFSRMSGQCFNKCITSYAGNADELAIGELTCLDRCVMKFMGTQAQVGEMLQKINAEQQKKAEAMAALQQQFSN